MSSQASIKTPGTIWGKLIDQNNANAKRPDGRGDAYVYFVGSRASGKSTLLNRFLYPNRIEVPKPSEGLEYTYARKPSTYDHERKDLAHIWEVGGSQEFAEEIAQGDQIFLNVKQVTTAVVVIVVDLSEPSTVLSTAAYWLEQIKKKLTSTYEKFEKKGLQLPEQLRQRAKSKLYSQNEDKDVVWHSGISIVIAATKFDMFKDEDAEVKKVMARALRFIAHSHGANVMYLGGLHASSDIGSKETAIEKTLLDNFSRLMNHLIFTGLEKKPNMKMQPQFDHIGPLMIPAGTDLLRDIGRPRGGMDGTINAGLCEWKELFEKMFPPKADKAKTKFEIDPQYNEEEVDVVRARKFDELEAYRKEQEAIKEAAKRKLAMMKMQQEKKKQQAQQQQAAPRSGQPQQPRPAGQPGQPGQRPPGQPGQPGQRPPGQPGPPGPPGQRPAGQPGQLQQAQQRPPGQPGQPQQPQQRPPGQPGQPQQPQQRPPGQPGHPGQQQQRPPGPAGAPQQGAPRPAPQQAGAPAPQAQPRPAQPPLQGQAPRPAPQQGAPPPQGQPRPAPPQKPPMVAAASQ